MNSRILGVSIVLSLLFFISSISCDLESDENNTELVLTGDLSITNLNIGNPNVAENFRMITFDINWRYSWRTSGPSGNWDAAWVFIKYQVNGGEWQHATLSTSSEEHVAPQQATIDSPSDGKGVYIYRSEDGTGEFSASDVSLRWNYGLDNVDANSTVNVRIFGLEMVYIPEGSFYAGDNGAGYASFTKGFNDPRPWHITSEDAIEVTNIESGGYYYTSSRSIDAHNWNTHEDPSGSEFTIPADFPKGFRAIYCMKYEMTQQQYVDFLNTLTITQASARYNSEHYEEFGYTILREGEQYSTTNPQRACGFISAADGFAYADWAGIRPMTDIEYEKICRGSGNLPIDYEYAWGSTNRRNVTVYNGDESDRELFTSERKNTLHYNGIEYPELPLNVGIFFEVGKSRELSGATFYGVLDMSGNLNEPCITIGNRFGRIFTYHNGDGLLAPDGFTNEPNWPLRNGLGAGQRGGNLALRQNYLQVSDRLEAALEIDWDHRHIPWGFRGVRTE